MHPLDADYTDRFSGIGRLYGGDAMARLAAARVAVIGIGGVGSWAAEALARSGVGEITLIDLDEVCVTNVNRQIHALDGTVGRTKVEVVGERLRLIHPSIVVRDMPCFFVEANADEILSAGFDVIIDAIDEVKQKAFLIAACRERGIPLVVAGGAGGKRDPSRLATADLNEATNDRLLKLVRKTLRREYRFPPEHVREPWGIRSVFSTENAAYPWSDGSVRAEPEPGSHLRLNCESGFGTATMVTGSFGFASASEAIEVILSEQSD
ncbi:MAG: tRNA threonylcarbamoyladenosine dehydratase [Verrucomicrobiota bacterium]